MHASSQSSPRPKQRASGKLASVGRGKDDRVARLFGGDTGGREAGDHVVKVVVARQKDGGVSQGGGSLRRRRRAGALPRIRAEVVVIAACRQEGCGGAEVGHEAEAEDVAIKPDRL